MADRSVKVNLIAQVSGYVAGMEQAARKTREMGSEAEKLGQKQAAISQVGQGLLAVGAIAQASFLIAVAKAAEFDAAMSSVQAATMESGEAMVQLRDAAVEAGASTVFTATEAANAIEELAKAGVSTADILGGGLAGALDLASAGQLGVARAAEISATAMQQFGLSGDQASHIADVLSAGAGKAMGSVEDLAQGLKFVGPVAASMGVSLEQTTGTLALFAQQGIIGEQAGTSLRGVLASLTSPSATARKEIERLGITLYDSQGNFLGLQNAAGELSKAYRDMDGASRDASLGVIFGRETVTAATALYNAGAEGVAEWTGKVNDSGFAAEQARLKLDNLRGDIEKLGGAFDTALIQSGSTANETLRALVQTATFLVDGIGQLPEPVLGVATALTAVGGAAALAGGAALLAVPKLVEMRTAMTTLGISGRQAAIGLGVATGAIAVATLAIGALVARQADIAATTKEFTDTLDDATGALTSYSRAMVARKLAESGAYEAAREAGVSQKQLTDAVLEGGAALDEVNSKLTANNTFGSFFTGVGIRAGNASDSIRDLRTSVVDSGQAFADQKAAMAGAEDQTSRVADAVNTLSGKAESASIDISELAAQVRGFASGELDAREAARQFENAVDAVAAAVAENGTTLDIGTEAGRRNEAALDAIATAASNAAAATLERGGSEDEARAAVQRGRDELILALGQFQITGAEAEAYADKLGLIPGNINTAVTASTRDAQNAIDTFIDRNTGRTIRVNTALNERVAGYNGSGGLTFAEGGYTGQGGKYEPAGVVHRGEYVFSKEATERIGVRALEQAHLSALRGYAQGGYVQARPQTYAQAEAPQEQRPFEGTLYLDSGEFLGVVRGEVRSGVGSALRSEERARSAGSARF